MDKQAVIALIDEELKKARVDLERHIRNVSDYLYREDWHGVWDFGVECQNAKDVIKVLNRLREKIEGLS